MDITLCTIGFAGKTAQEFFTLLASAKVQKVIDIRLNRAGQLSAYARYPDIAFFLERVGGIAYQHEPALAPTPEILKTYRKSRDWAGYESAFLALMKQRGVPQGIARADYEGNVALLCSEPGPEKCHRRLVADLLAEHWRMENHSIEVRHLVIERKRTPRARKRESAA